MSRTIRRSVSLALSGGILAAGATSALGAVTGSGASFPSVAYRAWCADSGKCSYTSKGSTGGINDFINGVVDFAASDAPLTDQQKADLAAKRGGATVVYFPTLLGAITVPTNVEGVTDRLRMDGKTIAKIFKGEVGKWNDPAIAGLNKGTTLPDKPITVCVRSDGSGTSFNFTKYLTKTYAPFGSSVGFAQIPDWSKSTANIIRSPQNAGVGNCVKSTANSIGYVDLGDALNLGLASKITAVGRAELRVIKRKGQKPVRKAVLVYSVPTTETIAKAATNDKTVPADLLADFSLSSVSGAYPITITTWLLGYSDYAKAGKADKRDEFKSVLDYFYSAPAQAKLPSIGFAPLPANIVAKAKAQLASIA